MMSHLTKSQKDKLTKAAESVGAAKKELAAAEADETVSKEKRNKRIDKAKKRLKFRKDKLEKLRKATRRSACKDWA